MSEFLAPLVIDNVMIFEINKCMFMIFLIAFFFFFFEKGTGVTKAGFAGADTPACVFDTLYERKKNRKFIFLFIIFSVSARQSIDE